MKDIRERIAVIMATWKIADNAAQYGEVIDIDWTARDLLARHPRCELQRTQIAHLLEEAAVKMRATILSDSTASDPG